MARILLKGGRVVDPANGLDRPADVLVENGKIVAVEPRLEAGEAAEIDVRGKVVAPGLVDVHTHLRDPGFTYKEDIVSGTRAAAAGGFTTLLAMPNTEPVCDHPQVVEYVLSKAKQQGLVNVLPLAAITVGQRGKELAPLEALRAAGAAGFSDDGQPVHNSGIMREALLRAGRLGKTLAVHCEDLNLTGNGVINAGPAAERLSLHGIPYTSQAVMVARDLLLAEETGTAVHICHVSCARSVELVREAKKRGIKVTAEVVHHFLNTTDEDIVPDDTSFKIKPPFGSKEDMAALKEGLRDGTLDVIATDHAPHSPAEKARPFQGASPFGAIGLETALAVVLTELVHGGVLTLSRALAAMTCRPAAIFGLDKGTLGKGREADIVVIDPELTWEADAGRYQSKARNCPQHGRVFKGRAILAMVGGRIVMRDGEIVQAHSS